MSSNAFPRSVRRPALLAGSAMLALLLAATGAQAQTAGATANGAQALANEQSLRSGIIVADASDTAIRSVTTVDIDRSDLGVSDDKILVTGKGNVAKLDLAASVTNGGAAYRVAGLAAGPNGASVAGTSVIANHQSLGSALVNGDIVGARTSIATGGAVSSKLTLSSNAQDAAATGNDAAVTISAFEGGAGTSSSQTMDARSGVAARARGGFAVATGPIEASQIDASGNLDRAVATGNSVETMLSLEAPVLALDERSDLATIVPVTSGGDSIVNAAVAAATSQSASGIVKAVTFEDDANPVFGTAVNGDAMASSIDSNGNLLTAAARGNMAKTGIDVAAASIAQSVGQTGRPAAVAATVTVQKASGLDLAAFAIGGTSVVIDGNLSGSDVSASQNEARTVATANQSDSELSLTATSIDTVRGRALASVDATGLSTADAGAVVHSVQDYGSSLVRASHTEAKTGVTIAGPSDGSRISVDGNSDLVAATGNNAASMLTIDAGTLATSVGVNSLQTGNGDVFANSGGPGIPGGVRVTADGDASNSTISVRDNSYLASAIGNFGTNGIAITAGAMRGVPGSTAVSASIGEGYGAEADVALASNQKVGEPTNEGTLIPTILSRVFTQSGIAANGATGSALAVEDNQQQATAIGNTVANRLSVSATDLGEGGQGAGTSLASSQFGQATVSATSDASWLSGGHSGSLTSLSGNSNAALASINDADNALSTDAVTAGGAGVADAASDRFGPPLARGDNVLTNQQFANGSASAFVTTTISGRVPAAGMDGSTYRVTGNRTNGEASANRAVNAVTARAIDGAFGAGLANTQINAATTQVSATGSTSASLGSMVSDSEVRIEGNAVSALARGNAAENSVVRSTGSGMPSAIGSAVTDRFGSEVSGGAVLLNSQTNFAPVIASAAVTSFLVPLNGGTVDGSRFSVSGNSVSANGYGNFASNSVIMSGSFAPSAAIASNQVNNGNVYAIVTGTGLDGAAGSLGASNFSISGNQLSAMAVGNQVSSAITGAR